MIEAFTLHPSFERLNGHLCDLLTEALKVELDYEVACMYISYLLSQTPHLSKVFSILCERTDIWKYIKQWDDTLKAKISEEISKQDLNSCTFLYCQTRPNECDWGILMEACAANQQLTLDMIEKNIFNSEQLRQVVKPETACAFLETRNLDTVSRQSLNILFEKASQISELSKDNNVIYSKSFETKTCHFPKILNFF